jgi:membrane protein
VRERLARFSAEARAAVVRPVAKFFEDRGTHLAAMIAYFALLSLVPLVFLSLALLGLFGRIDESSYLVTELKLALPDASIDQIVSVVRGIQANAAALGILGGIFLAWSSLSLFSVLESAFNIVYRRPNRPFVRGKVLAVVLVVSSLVVLLAALFVGTIGVNLLEDYAPSVLSNTFVARVLSLLVSTAGLFVFLVSVYYLLTNERLTLREVLAGATIASILLQLTFQALPIFFDATKDSILSIAAIGTPVLLLIWLYVMANVIVLGAEINWWWSRGRHEPADETAGLA